MRFQLPLTVREAVVTTVQQADLELSRGGQVGSSGPRCLRHAGGNVNPWTMLPLPLLVILTPRMLVLLVVLAAPVPVPRPTALPSVGLCKWLRVAAMTAGGPVMRRLLDCSHTEDTDNRCAWKRRACHQQLRRLLQRYHSTSLASTALSKRGRLAVCSCCGGGGLADSWRTVSSGRGAFACTATVRYIWYC